MIKVCRCIFNRVETETKRLSTGTEITVHTCRRCGRLWDPAAGSHAQPVRPTSEGES